ncbi:MAG TPA: phytanoyl-CoA dioxygenase family protein [Chlamydiales bacterium]|nr:phytanoyl-CoA dioxygenase family protein [Chlamydiales bacterium]
MLQTEEDRLLMDQMDERGYSLLPFPQELRALMLSHIETHLRELGSGYVGAKKALEMPLEQVALAVPDEIWSEKMNRAFRMFPKGVAQKIFEWADEKVRKKVGRTRSDINRVPAEEVKINPKLDKKALVIYWRCVRPGKPDAGRPHRDADFWVLAFQDGYDPQIPFPFDYIKDSIKIWIPLKGCTPKTTLQIIPGSHRIEGELVVEDTEYGRRPTLSDVWLEEHKNDFISPIELSKGNCIVFDMNLVHKGPTHNNNELRISAELTLIVQ